MEKNKILFLDLETTGLDPLTNSIVQIAAEYHIDGKKQDQFFVEIKPPISQDRLISLDALKVTKLNLNKIFNSGKDEGPALISFVDWVLSLDANKLSICGHNVHFDIAFMKNLFRRYNLNGWDNIISHRIEDTCSLARSLQKAGILPNSSVSLGSLAELLNITIPENETLHNAKTDVRVTSEIYYKLINKLKLMTGVSNDKETI